MDNDDNFDGSFRIYIEPNERPVDANERPVDALENEPEDAGHLGPENVPQALEAFYKDVYNVKDDMKQLEMICTRVAECTEWFKIMTTAKSMMELRAKVNMEMANAIKLAKLISKKYDGLVMSNAAQRMDPGNGLGSESDKVRVTMISDIGENVKAIIRVFQGLRVRAEAYNKEIIDDRYLSITGEKATEEGVQILVSCTDHESLLRHAIGRHGKAAVLDAVSEIGERRDVMKEVRKSLMSLHQILLGITSPVEKQSGLGMGGLAKGGSGLPSPVDTKAPTGTPSNNTNAVLGKKIVMGKLNDYERETRKQAYIAMVIALMCSLVIVTMWLWAEDGEDDNNYPIN